VQTPSGSKCHCDRGSPRHGVCHCKGLFNEGARVAILDIDEKGVMDSALQLDGKYGRVIGRRVDVTNRSEVEALVSEIKSLWGSVGILVNNAGGALNTPYILEEIDEKDWNLVVDVNLKGAFLCCQAAIPEMARKGRGAIVNISALAATGGPLWLASSIQPPRPGSRG